MKAKLPVEVYLPLLLSAAAVLGVSPFLVIRLVNGEWVMAAVDAAIIGAFAFLGLSVLRPRRVRFASVCIAILCVVGMLTTIYVQEERQVFWAYPALLAVFYLVKPGEAVLIAAVTILALAPELVPTTEPLRLTTIFITLIMTSTFAYAFAFLTRGQRDQLLVLARKDPLTGVGNRRALDEKLAEVCASQTRSNVPASMLLLDIDNFKEINDEFGHAAGDQILVRLTEVIELRIRVTDSLYRIGGEEFVVVLEGQKKDQARRLAEQLRTLVEANELAPGGTVTISLGVAELGPGERPEQWLRRADVALYESKRSGRNQTSLATTGKVLHLDPNR
ncbi:MAG TPA: GGDEF domain-containing protein [Woeseiaceae bacterium]|nr:GGDEF domain-containing protein [Woeseiaceae bacterium]